MLGKIFNFTNLATAVALAYVAFIANKFYLMLNPLEGVEIAADLPTIDPLWPENQAFDMICYLSTSNKFKEIDVEDMRRHGQLLFEKVALRHNSTQEERYVELLLTTREDVGSSGSSMGSTIGQQNMLVHIPQKKIWKQLHNNSSQVYLHVLLSRHRYPSNSHTMDNSELDQFVPSSGSDSPTITSASADTINRSMLESGEALHGVVGLVKFDKVPKHFRHRYLLSDFGWVNVSTEDAAKASINPDTVISYWKPEVTVKLVNDFTRYPYDYLPSVIYKNVVYKSRTRNAGIAAANSDAKGSRHGKKQNSPTGNSEMVYKPPIHVDEIGLTSDKYVPLNETVRDVPLKISIAPLSVQRWLLMAHMADSLNAQTDMGFTDKDIDDVRRLISETSLYLLGLTMLASLLHLLFEFLAFQSDISFWQNNKSLAGLSTRAVVTELVSQVVVFLFLVDTDSSLLITVPFFFGVLIQAWKVYKATGLRLRVGRFGLPVIEFSRWKADADADGTADTTTRKEAETAGEINTHGDEDSGSGAGIADRQPTAAVAVVTTANTRPTAADASVDSKQQATAGAKPEGIDTLTRVTLEADRFSTFYISAALLPLVLLFTLRSLLYEKHASWYSWAIGALTGSVYAFGFALMCPQLYINHQLKSVSHLPWKFLVYKFLNTFIDDLFAFIIKMPTMHRLSVFRDDLVFLIYLYQRWIYRVDESRPIEK